MRCHLHLSPTTVIISTTNTRLIRELWRWPIHSCSKASWLCSHSLCLKKALSRSPPASSMETQHCWRRTTSCLSACATFCLAVGDLVGKREQPESDTGSSHRQQGRMDPHSQYMFCMALRVPTALAELPILLCCLPLWKLALRVGNV